MKLKIRRREMKTTNNIAEFSCSGRCVNEKSMAHRTRDTAQHKTLYQFQLQRKIESQNRIHFYFVFRRKINWQFEKNVKGKRTVRVMAHERWRIWYWIQLCGDVCSLFELQRSNSQELKRLFLSGLMWRETPEVIKEFSLSLSTSLSGHLHRT